MPKLNLWGPSMYIISKYHSRAFIVTFWFSKDQSCHLCKDFFKGSYLSIFETWGTRNDNLMTLCPGIKSDKSQISDDFKGSVLTFLDWTAHVLLSCSFFACFQLFFVFKRDIRTCAFTNIKHTILWHLLAYLVYLGRYLAIKWYVN